jgi:GTP-binding protein
MAILGRQNVGKSTLLNALVSENRVITGSVPGLTRDSIAVDFTYGPSRPSGPRSFSIVDTAGIRRASRRSSSFDSIEDDSVLDALRSMKLAHVCVLVLEAEALHLTKQELTIADGVIREGRALVVVANKSDTMEGTPDEYAMGVKVSPGEEDHQEREKC